MVFQRSAFRRALGVILSTVVGTIAVVVPHPKPAMATEVSFGGPAMTSSNGFDAADAGVGCGVQCTVEQVLGGVVPNTVNKLKDVINTLSLRPWDPPAGPPPCARHAHLDWG